MGMIIDFYKNSNFKLYYRKSFFRNNRWRYAQELKIQRSNHAVCLFQNKILAMGGFQGMKSDKFIVNTYSLSNT